MKISANKAAPPRTCSGVQKRVCASYVLYDGLSAFWTPEQVRRGVVLVAALLFITSPAFAAGTLTDCQLLPEYQPSADVDYKPGVDVKGKPVVPADLTPSVIDVPKQYSFDLNVDAARLLGATVPAGTQGLMKAGTVTIDTATGAATWNGKPLEGDQLAGLKAICAGKKPETPPNDKPPQPQKH